VCPRQEPEQTCTARYGCGIESNCYKTSPTAMHATERQLHPSRRRNEHITCRLGRRCASSSAPGRCPHRGRLADTGPSMWAPWRRNSTLGSTCTSREWDGIERRIWSVGHQVEVDADRPPAVFDSVYRSEPCRPDPRPFGVSLPTTDRSDWACVDRRRGPSSTRLGHLCACARVHRDPGR